MIQRPAMLYWRIVLLTALELVVWLALPFAAVRLGRGRKPLIPPEKVEAIVEAPSQAAPRGRSRRRTAARAGAEEAWL